MYKLNSGCRQTRTSSIEKNSTFANSPLHHTSKRIGVHQWNNTFSTFFKCIASRRNKAMRRGQRLIFHTGALTKRFLGALASLEFIVRSANLRGKRGRIYFPSLTSFSLRDSTRKMSLQNSRFAPRKMIMGLRVCLDSANDFLDI